MEPLQQGQNLYAHVDPVREWRRWGNLVGGWVANAHAGQASVREGDGDAKGCPAVAEAGLRSGVKRIGNGAVGGKGVHAVLWRNDERKAGLGRDAWVDKKGSSERGDKGRFAVKEVGSHGSSDGIKVCVFCAAAVVD